MKIFLYYILTIFCILIEHISLVWRSEYLFRNFNGNLAQIISCKNNTVRLHEWDEENRLRFVLGDKEAGYYGYDGNGERVYKLTGISSIDQINSGVMNAQLIFDNATLYPNPYIVITPQGYTKHYYAGTERLATVIGGGGFSEMRNPIDILTSDDAILTHQFGKYDALDPFLHANILNGPTVNQNISGEQYPELDYACGSATIDRLTILTAQDILYESIDHNSDIRELETEIYYNHSDHLGSANWITDANGDVVQYIHYAPYGELLANQTPYLYDERFKFTGKERDEESGYDYFSARYLWQIVGHWLSVDPLADKYLWISPYAYAAWNPIKFVDPDGKKCTLSVNYRTNTITISAKYYASRNDSRYAMKAANFLEQTKRTNIYHK